MTDAEPARILLVEDQPTIAQLERNALEKSGFLVEEVGQGLRALERLATGDGISLMVLDYRLPDMTGADVVEALGDQIERLPVLVVTGYPDPAIERSMRDAGVDHYMVKDIGMSFLERLPRTAQSVLASYAA